jgi:hypothetical protein
VRSSPHVTTLRAGQVNTVRASPRQAYVVTVANHAGRLVRNVVISLDPAAAVEVWIGSIRPRQAITVPLRVRQPLDFGHIMRVTVTVRAGGKATSRASYRVMYVSA